MKNFKLNERQIKLILSIIIIICSAVAFEKLLSNASVIAGGIASFFGFFKNLLSPFIIGFSIAYLINPAVSFIETKILRGMTLVVEKKKIRPLYFVKRIEKRGRFVSAVVMYMILIGFAVWMIAFLIPEIINSTRSLISSIRAAQANFSNYYYSSDFFKNLLAAANDTFSLNYTYQDIIDIIFDPLMRSVSSLPDILGMVLIGTVSAAYRMLNLLIGLVISFHMIMQKEKLQAAALKLTKALLKRQTAETAVNIAKNANHMFKRFFIGKITDSLIVGIIFFIACLFIKPPYTVLLTIIMAVTNMIPYFGPWVGGAIIVVIVLIRNPVQALWMTALVFVLQQIDGSIIGPKVLGDSTGLKPLDIIFAIMIGGALFGVPGMFVGVPLYAVLKNMAAAIISRRYNMKYERGDTDPS